MGPQIEVEALDKTVLPVVQRKAISDEATVSEQILQNLQTLNSLQCFLLQVYGHFIWKKSSALF
jgi:hypothetical protein